MTDHQEQQAISVRERELAKLCGVCPKTIRNWRALGLPFRKIGGTVVYIVDEVRFWMQNQNGGQRI